MAVTLLVSVAELNPAPPVGAYIRLDIMNCVNPTIVGNGTILTPSQKFFLNQQSSVNITVPDNVSQIACNGNCLSYYTITYVEGANQTLLKSVCLPPGTFTASNLVNITEPPFNPGIVQGPPGPPGVFSGFSGTVTIAKLTTGGTNGSLLFSEGILSSVTAAT